MLLSANVSLVWVILLYRTSITATVFVQVYWSLTLLCVWVSIFVITFWSHTYCSLIVLGIPRLLYCLCLLWLSIALISWFYCYQYNLVWSEMEGEHIDQSSMGGFVVNESRDTQSKYSGDPLFLQNSNHWGMTLWVLRPQEIITYRRVVLKGLLWGLRLNWVLLMAKVLVLMKIHPITNNGFILIVWWFRGFWILLLRI